MKTLTRQELIDAIEAAARQARPTIHKWQIGLFEMTGSAYSQDKT